MRTKQRLAIGAAATMMLASIYPWASSFGLISLNGLQCRFGWGTLLAGGLLVAIELRPRWMTQWLGWVIRHERPVKVGMSCMIILVCLFVVFVYSLAGPFVQAQWGLYLTLAAATAVVWSAPRRIR